MMHVWTDGLDGVEPQSVNQIEVAGRERWRMGAEVIGVGAAAPVIDDESNIEGFRLVGVLPGLAQQSRLILGRQRRRFAHVDVRRSKANDGADDCVHDVAGGDDQQAHGTADAFGQGDDVRQQSPFVRRRRGLRRLSSLTSTSMQSCRHDDDVPIAWRLQCGDDVGEGMRIAHRDQHVAGTRLELGKRQIRGAEEIEGLFSNDGVGGLAARLAMVKYSADVAIRAADAMAATSPLTNIARTDTGNDSRHQRPDETRARQVQVRTRLEWRLSLVHPSQPRK